MVSMNPLMFFDLMIRFVYLERDATLPVPHAMNEFYVIVTLIGFLYLR
jgi:hypothetical protein